VHLDILSEQPVRTKHESAKSITYNARKVSRLESTAGELESVDIHILARETYTSTLVVISPPYEVVAAIQAVTIPQETTQNPIQGLEHSRAKNALILESHTGAEVFFNRMVEIGSKNMSV
jgi:hypothetical protein